MPSGNVTVRAEASLTEPVMWATVPSKWTMRTTSAPSTQTVALASPRMPEVCHTSAAASRSMMRSTRTEPSASVSFTSFASPWV